MKPYKIPGTSRWVDLEAIQSMDEPVVKAMASGTPVIEINYTLAFQEQPAGLVWRPDSKPEGTALGWDLAAKAQEKRREILATVFQPFLEAWMGSEHVEASQAPATSPQVRSFERMAEDPNPVRFSKTDELSFPTRGGAKP